MDTCKGDGGSPLVCQKQQGTWYQAGIVSFGIGCGETGFPAVYADVSFASCWIDRQVRFMVGMILVWVNGVWFMVRWCQGHLHASYSFKNLQVSQFYGEAQGSSYFGFTKEDCSKLSEELDLREVK